MEGQERGEKAGSSSQAAQRRSVLLRLHGHLIFGKLAHVFLLVEKNRSFICSGIFP